jgi:hypothetical protein
LNSQVHDPEARAGESLRATLFPVNYMRTLLLILVALILPLAACRDSTGPTGIDGEYTLVTINTQALPVTIFGSNAGRIDITGSTLVLRSDLTYTETINRHLVLADTAYSDIVIEKGSYEVRRNAVTFTPLADDGGQGLSYTGTVEGNTLTYRFREDSYVYRK